MRILYVGDIMGPVGIEVVQAVLPQLIVDEAIDVVIAQGENVTNGRGLSPTDFRTLKQAGVDFCTGGNWSLYDEAIIPLLADETEPVIRPANYPKGTPGLGAKYLHKKGNKLLVVSLLGHIVGKDADKPINNPLQCIDAILKANKEIERQGTVVNLHGDYSSEKVVIGHYLDGRATMVVGDHWHVPTADAQVLPSGTAHQTDVGMCGSFDSSLGVTFESVLPRWRDNAQTRNVLATTGRRQFNALLVESDDSTGLAMSVQTIRRIIN